MNGAALKRSSPLAGEVSRHSYGSAVQQHDRQVRMSGGTEGGRADALSAGVLGTFASARSLSSRAAHRPPPPAPAPLGGGGLCAACSR